MKKFIATLLSLTMLLTLVPAAFAANEGEEDSMDKDLIASASFDKWLEPEVGGAEALGTTSYAPALYGNGAYFSGSYANRVKITAADGADNLLVGRNAVTITFFENRYGATWPLFISPNTADQVYNSSENYIALFDNGGEFKVERYVGRRDDKKTSSVAKAETYPKPAAGSDGWRHVAIVLTDQKTDLYVDGELVATAASGSKLSDLFKTESYINIGGGDWAKMKNGNRVTETFEGIIDEFRIYGRELTEEEIASLAAFPSYTAKQVADSLEIPDANGVLDNLDLPTEKNGANISWVSSEPDIITDEAVTNGNYTMPAGVVNRDAEPHDVTLTATVSLDGETEERTFNLTVKPLEPIKDEDMKAYLYVYFRGNVNGSPEHLQIHMATSEDGYNWTDLNGNFPILTSTMGTQGLRDPYLLRSRYGDKFYVIATDLDNEAPWDPSPGKQWGPWSLEGSKHLMVWESTDLVNWSEQRMVKFADENIGCAWAPESIYDPDTGEYLVYASGKDLEMDNPLDTVYVTRTRDFRSFSKPQRFFIPTNPKDGKRAAAIDSTIIRADDGNFYQFYKKYNSEVWMMVSEHAAGPYEEVASFSPIKGEGPAIYKVNGTDKYALCIDDYSKYIPYLTDDIASGIFTMSTDEVVMPTGSKHGGMIPITGKEYEALLDAYGPAEVSADGSGPDFSLDFEKDTEGLKGGAVIADDADKGGKVLTLDGVDGYYEFPEGTFDRRDSFTLIFDVKSDMGADDKFFTFGLGNLKDTEKYLFFRARNNQLRMAETISGWTKEREAKNDNESVAGEWARIALVVKPGYLAIYKNGRLVAEAEGLNVADGNGGTFTTSHLGVDGLTAYLGKSFFEGDKYMAGSFDNVALYYRALDADEIIFEANPDMTDEDLLDAEVEAISLPDRAITAIDLPTKGVYGAAISWESSDESVITADGKVNRPAPEEGDAEVTLTGTYEYKGKICVVEYVVKVKAQSALTWNSTDNWDGHDIDPVTDKALIEFDIIPHKDKIDGFIGLCSSGAQPGGWGDYNVIIRTTPDGVFDAHNGSDYVKSAAAYTAGKIYHVTLAADVVAKTFSAWVTDEDGETVKIADNFGFRSKAGSDLAKMTVRGGDKVAAGEFSVENYEMTAPRAEASLGWNGEDFTIDFTALGADSFDVYSEAEPDKNIGRALADGETGLALSTADSNRRYQAVAAYGEINGEACAPVSVYSLVAKAVVDFAFDGEITADQLVKANDVLNKGGIYIKKTADGKQALTDESALLMTLDGDTVTLKDKAVKAGLRFAKVSYAVADGKITDASANVSEDGVSVTIDGLASMEAETIYLEDVEFVLDVELEETASDETVSGELDFIEEV